MKLPSEILKSRRALLLASAMSIAALPTAGLAADQPAPVLKAAPAEIVSWYFYGGFEAGGRWVFDRPPTGFGRAPAPENWITSRTGDSRAKFQEYGEISSAPFLDYINLNFGTTDGRWAVDFWVRNVGLDNQSYNLDIAAVGQHYLSLSWDQTPHLISTSAKSIFGGVGTTNLTVPDAVQAALQPQLRSAANAAPPAIAGVQGNVARAVIENTINNNVTALELKTNRDKASAAYRWTPNPDTDVSVNYTHEDRTGLRPVGIGYGYAFSASPTAAPASNRPTNPVEAPQPLKDTTQNFNGKAEYVGTTWFGTRFVASGVYNGSWYDNDLKVLNVENPFCLTCSVFSGQDRAPNMLRLGLYPDNHANAFTGNVAVDLPFWRSRYVTTVQYNDMRQNSPFVDTGTNGLATPTVTIAGTNVPVTSLNGHVGTFLWNNVYTASITKDLKFTAKARYYDVDNMTPSLHIENWIFGDSGCAGGAPSATGVCSVGGIPRNSLPISYTKDNASAEAVWRAASWASIGGTYLFERIDRKLREVPRTDEHTGKVFGDFTFAEPVRFRVSYAYSERRYDEYDPALVEDPGIQFSESASNLRRFDVANRNRQKAEAQLEWAPANFLNVTPNLGVRWDDYPDSAFNPLGVSTDHSWNGGLEVGFLVSPVLRLLAAYNYENRELKVAGGSGANYNSGSVLTGCSTSTAINPDAIIGTDCTWRSNIEQTHNTYMVAADWKAVPSRLDFRVEYLMVKSSEANNTKPCAAPSLIAGAAVGTNCNGLATTGSPVTLVDPSLVNNGQFPTEKNTLQRFNVVAKYYVDPVFVKDMGWKGDVTVKLRYTWEQNRNNNWATEGTTPYIPTADTTELTGANRSIFLAAFNPNYTAQLIALSLQVKW